MAIQKIKSFGGNFLFHLPNPKSGPQKKLEELKNGDVSLSGLLAFYFLIGLWKNKQAIRFYLLHYLSIQIQQKSLYEISLSL